MVDGGDFTGTICSICYEGLKPITEDLQSISICGHVFHELCLQQWFEYCSSKKQSCPVCKQGCKANDACRLYFQSVGDSSDAVVTQKLVDFEEDAGVLRREVKRLECKVLGLSSALEGKSKELEELTEELSTSKERAKREIALKNEALNQKTSIQFQLRTKSEELEKSSLECFRLKDRNMALAKELAALKLVSDLDLDEEEVLKLATLGNGANSNETVDTLKRSLVLRNRSYKELMAKCNVLGRGEARYSKKLDKAKEKIIKLKARVQDLETIAEAKEKVYLMSLKAPKNLENRISSNSDVLLTTSKFSSKEQRKQISTPKPGTGLTANSSSESAHPLKIDNSKATKNKAVDTSSGGKTTLSLDNEEDCIIINDDASKAAHGTKNETSLKGKCNVPESSRIDIMDEDVTLLQANVEQVQPMVNIRKESPLTISNSGDICFSGGLLGPDGTHRYLGKWCKRGQNGEPKDSSNGNLIAIGSDGRGGRVKVLRTPGQGFSWFTMKDIQMKNVFFSRCLVKDVLCFLVIDKEYWINMASTTMVEKLRLPIVEHPDPYQLRCLEDPEFKNVGDVMVTKQVRVAFKFGEYEDEVLCDVAPTKTRHLLLGRPWKNRRQARMARKIQQVQKG